MYFASGNCTRVLPPSKRQKAPKIAWTRCPSYFSIPPSATSCTHLPLQGRQKGLFNFDEARFSHFIDSLRRTIFAQSSFIHLYYLKFKNAGAIINRPCVILFRLNALHLRPRRINFFTVHRFICTNTNIIFFLCLKLFNLILSCFLLLSYIQKRSQVSLTSFHFF